MNNWLDKYEQGGMVLKQKTKDNYGKKANPNNPDVSLPPGFKGLAYNTKGRNYSPAWGGQFQMGGSLPGAVGFTYARTAGAAPSNGPYAKKTKASAQNGKEMKFYQAGLDFKPKTISQDGSEIPVDPMGYWNPDNIGNPVIIPSNEITMEGVDQPLIGISDTGDVQYMYPGEDYTFDGESVTEYPVAQNGKTLPTVKVKKEPIYVDDPRDPRLRAYQDSLSSYEQGRKIASNLGKIFDDYYGYTGSKAKYSPYFYKNYEAGKLKHSLSGNEGNIFGSTVPPISQRDLNNEIDYWRSSVDGDTGRKVAEELKKYSKIKTKPYRGLVSAELPSYQVYKKPTQPVEYRKPQPTALVSQQPAPQPQVTAPIVEKRQNIYEGSPVYSPGAGSGLPSALIGFLGQQGDTTYIKPEDYERFAVPKYGKQFIESKKKQRNGGVNKADEYPIEKLDQSLNFTNYNKPTKGGWLDKYN